MKDRKVLLVGSLASGGLALALSELERQGVEVLTLDGSEEVSMLHVGKPRNYGVDGRGTKGDRIRKRQQWRRK